LLSVLRVIRVFGCSITLLLSVATYSSDKGDDKEPPVPLPGAPYFDFKQQRGLIKGSHSILPSKPIVIGTVRQVLVDRFIVDSTWNCFRRVHKPEKYPGNPVIKTVGAGSQTDEIFTPEFWASVLYDRVRNRYRVWGATSRISDQVHLDLGTYSESEDGIHWNSPALGIVEWKGSRTNNLFMGGNGYRTHTFSIVELPPRLRSKGRFALLYLRILAGKQPAVGHSLETRIAFSDDGVHFRDQLENPVIKGRSDTHNNMVYNPERDVFMMYRRATVNAHEVRRIAYSESRDLISWTQPVVVVEPDELDAPMLYGMTVSRYQGIYLGFLQMFYAANAGYAGPRLYRDGRIEKELHIDAQLAWSRDGIQWERHPQRPIFLETGIYGSYDWGRVYLNQGVIEKGDQLYMYYRGVDTLHVPQPRDGGEFCLATLRKDGFVSLDTPGTGYMLTKPLLCPGGKLHINAKTEPGGFIRVAVRRGDGVNDGDWLEGWDYQSGAIFSGDKTDATVPWNGKEDFGLLKDQAIRLHFWMEKAQLYSFWYN